MPKSMPKLSRLVPGVVLTAALSACSGAQTSTSAPTPTVPSSAASTSTATAAVTQSPAVPTPTPVPGTPTDAPGASPTATCEGGAAPDFFQPDSIACVVDGPLRLRSKPSTADDSLKLEPLLATGEMLFIIDGPTDASGYPWYLVERTPGYINEADGWVAGTSREGAAWLTTATITCPPTPTLADLAAADPMQRLHCYGTREFTFTDTVTWGPMCGDGNILRAPTFMAACKSAFWWGSGNRGPILAVPPEIADFIDDEVNPDSGFTATITAHMDADIAQTCIPHEGLETDYARLVPGVITSCRTMFVATAFQRVTP